MKSMKQILMFAGCAVALSSLSACGLTGDLKRPAPLFGEPREGLEAAELPTDTGNDLPDLPDRDDGDAPDSDDELLGGPEGL